MNGTFALADAVELAVVERGGFIESRHAGSAIVLAPDGAVSASLGDPGAAVFPRSALKPFQAIAVMVSGVPLMGERAALASASHCGTPRHIEVVRVLLADAGLPVSALRCPSDLPSDPASHDALIRDGVAASPLYMTCSGKHAAMLAACVKNDWPTESYLDPRHPLQVHILDVIERLTGEKVQATAVDGCGTPVHAMSLTALARGIQRIATAEAASPFVLFRSAAVLRTAMLDNGWAVEGDGRPNTVVIETLRVFAKFGAEGILVMAAPDGSTVALKILDGSLRAATLTGLKLLVNAGAIDASDTADLADRLGLAVFGGGRQVGRIRTTI